MHTLSGKVLPVLCLTVLLCGVFSFISCTDTVSPTEPLTAETAPADETLPAVIPAVKPPDAPVFESDFEARRAVANALELEEISSYYTKESVIRFAEFQMKVNAELQSVTKENAWEWLLQIEQVLASMEKAPPPELVPYEGDIPCVTIENPDGRVHDSYHAATVTVTYPADWKGDIPFSDPTAQVKLRGNSTKSAPKQPYTIKFEEKKSLAGMDKGKRWVLLANAFDKTMLRNKLAFDFCQNLSFAYSPEVEFVDVYVDGRYMGVYLLCEPVTDGKNRVDINPEGGDYLFELEIERTEAGTTYIRTPGGVRIKLNKPETLSSDEADKLKNILAGIEEIMQNGTFDEICEAVDIDSFADFYIFKEYFKDVDAYYSSTRFYLKDGKLCAGPPWDCDLTCGNASPDKKEIKYWSYCNAFGYGTCSEDSADGEWNDFGWFAMLWANAAFREKVLERWTELRVLCENQYTENELGISAIEKLLAEYKDNFEKNYTEGGWSLTARYSIDLERTPENTYDGNVEVLRDWMRRRITVVDALFGYVPRQ